MREYTPPHEKDPNIIETGPLKNPDERFLKQLEEAKKNYVPVDEKSPKRGENYSTNEKAPE